MGEFEKVCKIKSFYEEKEVSKLDELKALDKKVKRPAKVFSYIFGTIGALVLGTGMSIAMPDLLFANMMPLGIGVGALGIFMVSINYAIFKSVINARKKKYGQKIINLSNEILG